MHSVDLRRLLSLQVSHIYRSNVGEKSGILPKVNFLEKGRSVSFRIQGIEGKQVLSTITLQQTGWLAIILVFGPKGLILRSSMALIPTETTPISHEGKIHRFEL